MSVLLESLAWLVMIWLACTATAAAQSYRIPEDYRDPYFRPVPVNPDPPYRIPTGEVAIPVTVPGRCVPQSPLWLVPRWVLTGWDYHPQFRLFTPRYTLYGY